MGDTDGGGRSAEWQNMAADLGGDRLASRVTNCLGREGLFSLQNLLTLQQELGADAFYARLTGIRNLGAEGTRRVEAVLARYQLDDTSEGTGLSLPALPDGFVDRLHTALEAHRTASDGEPALANVVSGGPTFGDLRSLLRLLQG